MVFDDDISEKAVGFGISKKKSGPHIVNIDLDLDVRN